MTSVKDWNAHKISFRYDHDGNIIHQGNALTTAQPTGTSTTAFKYDASDALLTVATTYKGRQLRLPRDLRLRLHARRRHTTWLFHDTVEGRISERPMSRSRQTP